MGCRIHGPSLRWIGAGGLVSEIPEWVEGANSWSRCQRVFPLRALRNPARSPLDILAAPPDGPMPPHPMFLGHQPMFPGPPMLPGPQPAFLGGRPGSHNWVVP